MNERRLNRGINESLEDQHLAQEVWQLRLAFADEAEHDPEVYSASTKDWDDIRELAEHREPELALELVLAHGSASLSASLLAEARRVARSFCPDESEADVNTWVDAWLEWPASGVEPPHWNDGRQRGGTDRAPLFEIPLPLRSLGVQKEAAKSTDESTHR